MNKIVIRTVTQGYVVEEYGNPGEYAMEYAAETIEKVKEIVHLLLSAEENQNVVEENPTLIVDGNHYPPNGCKHEWIESQSSAKGPYCRICGVYQYPY